MRSVTITGPGTSELRSGPVPEPPPGWAVVRCRVNALCGTDVKLFAGAVHDARYPLVPGHEWCGEVLPGGDDARGLDGRLVVGDNYLPCASCAACRAGRPNLCEALEEIGFTRPGACADFVLLPAANLVPVPAGLDAREACLAEPLSVALHALERVPVRPDDRVLVLGAGTVGLLLAQAVRALAAPRALAVADVRPGRLARATDLGLDGVPIDPGGDPPPQGLGAAPPRALPFVPDVTFDATGAAGAFATACACTAPGGRVGLVGYSGEESLPWQPAVLMVRELEVRGVLSGVGLVPRAIELLASGAVRAGPLVGEVFDLDDYGSAVERAAGSPDDCRRVFVRP